MRGAQRRHPLAAPAAIGAAAIGLISIALVAGARATSARHPGSHGAPAVAVSAAAGRPCGWRSAPPHYTHVVWVLMENHSYSSIIGASDAPYINALARACGLATNYHNITHPSLPNYIAATSGLRPSALGPFTSDCDPGPGCQTAAVSLFAEARSWRAYEESMPAPCDRTGAGEYAVRHNPAVYYTRLAGCATRDLPYRALARDLARNQLPRFSFITPNLIDDMHDGTVAQGDHWLAVNLGALLRSRAYRSGNVVVFLTWDEGEGGSSSACATNLTDPGCRVATIVISPTTRPATRSSALLNHYALLHSTEQLLGLEPLGRADRNASMLRAFGLANG